MRFLTAVGVTILAAGVSAPLAHAQTPPRGIRSLAPFVLINQPVPPGLINSPRASRLEQISDSHLRLSGDVEIRNGAWQIFADQVDLFTDESRLVATGNVLFISADGRIAAERVEFNTETKTGTFYNVTVNGAPENP